ncbi:triosephosphate isomerase [Candidatus Gottesmanbacteria bacterium]|nr:triosephosphate isomerase [Candidatus Gottesmanbacteria bacterium]
MLFIANFKANKNSKETLAWLSEFHKIQQSLSISKPTVIIAPSFTALEPSAIFVKKNTWMFPLYLSAQDISEYPVGSYTGEVTAYELKEIVTYAIIGHSERRKLFAETEEVVNKKILAAKSQSIIPIVCISSINEYSKIKDVSIIAYEPKEAIGTGKAQNPNTAFKILKTIKKNNILQKVLYGGSVGKENVSGYIQDGGFDGVLVGSGSNDPSNFLKIIQYAGKK